MASVKGEYEILMSKLILSSIYWYWYTSENNRNTVSVYSNNSLKYEREARVISTPVKSSKKYVIIEINGTSVPKHH